MQGIDVIPSSQKSRSRSATVGADVASVELDWLIAALSLVTGAEAMVVLRDVCQLDAEAASAVTDWAARVLLDATFGERPA